MCRRVVVWRVGTRVGTRVGVCVRMGACACVGACGRVCMRVGVCAYVRVPTWSWDCERRRKVARGWLMFVIVAWCNCCMCNYMGMGVVAWALWFDGFCGGYGGFDTPINVNAFNGLCGGVIVQFDIPLWGCL